jgi:hypothetical protein
MPQRGADRISCSHGATQQRDDADATAPPLDRACARL